MTNDDYIDDVHRMSARAIAQIRAHVQRLHEDVARWEEAMRIRLKVSEDR